MQHEVAGDRAELSVGIRQRLRRCFCKLDSRVSLPSLLEHLFGEVDAYYCGAPFDSCSSNETRSGSEIQHMVTLGNTGFFQQRTNCLAHHCTKPIYVGRRAPRPSGMLEASHFLRVEVILSHEFPPHRRCRATGQG